MLNTLLDNLTSYFSKRAVISALFPCVVFIGLNAAIAWLAWPSVRKVTAGLEKIDLEKTVILGAVVFVGATIIMYALTAFSSRLREWLTGRGWPAFLREPMIRAHSTRFDELTREINSLQQLRADASDRRERWNSDILTSRFRGRTVGKSSFSGIPGSELDLELLRAARRNGNALDAKVLESVKKAIAGAFEGNSDQAEDENFAKLEELQLELQGFLDHEEQRLETAIRRLYDERQASYGDGAIAPTRVGNIARSIETYAQSRYCMNLDVFWSRLQHAMQDATYYGLIQDAKAQLDFFVATFWLVAMSCAFWMVVLPFTSESGLVFAAVVVAAPLFCWWLYGLVVASYVSFADLVRGAVDLYRFKLIEALHVALPKSLDEERQLWSHLTQIIGFDAKYEQQYKHS